MNSTIKAIKDKGFNFIKVECEANTQIESEPEYCNFCDEGYTTCDDCGGEGRQECSECDGSGEFEAEFEDDEGNTSYEWRTCEYCDGEGHEECSSCHGEGRWTCDECGGDYENCGNNYDTLKDEIMNRLPEHLQKAIVYQQIYYDSTVDTEWTFTIPIEKANSLPKYLKAFREASEDISGYFDWDNAGLHISISSEGNPERSTLDSESNRNFIKNMEKLLFGMTVLSSPVDSTRGFNYRRPQIRDNDKYSFIYSHGQRFYEYRLFDPCYQKPNHILKYVEVIAKSLKYYTPNKKVTARIKDLQGKEVMKDSRFFNDMFDTTEAKARAIKEVELLIGKATAQSHIKRAKLTT